MKIELAAAARIVPLTALMLGACVSQSAHKKLEAQLQAARTRAAAQKARNREPAAGAGPGRTAASKSCQAPVEETSKR